MAEKDKKYYWLKLKRDFFKRHDIQIIESMPNGKDYILFYLKLLCESVDHDGNLRFSEEIPYNEDMLSALTHTNIDIVRSAVKLFVGLHMIDIMDDGTYYMNQVQKMIGSETYWAQKKREQREKELELPSVGHCPTLSNGSPTCPSKSIEKDKELDIDLDINIDLYNKKSISDSPNPQSSAPSKSTKPTKHKHGEYQHVLLTEEQEAKLMEEYGEILTIKAIEFLDEYIEMKGYKAKNHYLAIRKWVIDAVGEREQKKGYNGQLKNSSFDTEQFFDKAVKRSMQMMNNIAEPPKTAATDESLRRRMESLKQELQKE